MALWDLRGKAWKQPLYQLLGGAVRKDIPFTDYFSLRGDGPKVKGEKTPEEVADYCVELHETHGTTFFEGKFSTQDAKISLRMIELIRRKLGDDVMIRIDSNQAYSLATARRWRGRWKSSACATGRIRWRLSRRCANCAAIARSRSRPIISTLRAPWS
ncbi:hypothetical protein AJ88_10105 [Mesorhizobium amorphae CCBAU 01583]|nr:hypothetical protein AJ88_10105 [Mesorhizobium amorphae CCBAU 01583]